MGGDMTLSPQDSNNSKADPPVFTSVWERTSKTTEDHVFSEFSLVLWFAKTRNPTVNGCYLHYGLAPAKSGSSRSSSSIDNNEDLKDHTSRKKKTKTKTLEALLARMATIEGGELKLKRGS
jgi:hypothetical protein